MKDLFRRVVLPVASVEDAEATVRSVGPYLDGESTVVAVHVVEKAGGAPDKASVEQREEYAAEIFEVVRENLDDVETDLRFATDVVESIFEAAGDHDATAIVFTPRGGSRWLRLLTGDVTLDIVTETDRPVVVLPHREPESAGDSSGQTGADR
jgi:nucleotide-binding universal stress UspA family protein